MYKMYLLLCHHANLKIITVLKTVKDKRSNISFKWLQKDALDYDTKHGEVFNG
jgi:hypothetical protein